MTDKSIPIPRIGLGTFGSGGALDLDGIRAALELGYRHVDTAQTYGTEPIVGQAIRQSGLPRREVFITTKVTDRNLGADAFLPSLRESLDRLQMDYVDLTLIHWPSPQNAVPMPEYLGCLAEAQAAGLTRAIGVSNFPSTLVDEAVLILGPGRLATNQVEWHPFLQNAALRTCCRRHGVPLTAYMPLAGGRVMTDPVLRELGRRRGVSAARLTLAWLLRLGGIVIPASNCRENLRDNLLADTVDLDAEDMATIESLDRAERLINPAKSPVWDPPHG